jgi:hypothetical protein
MRLGGAASEDRNRWGGGGVEQLGKTGIDKEKLEQHEMVKSGRGAAGSSRQYIRNHQEQLE